MNIFITTALPYTRGGQLDQLQEPHFRRQQSATAKYSMLKLIKPKYHSGVIDGTPY
jgi:hypothetical protein